MHIYIRPLEKDSPCISLASFGFLLFLMPTVALAWEGEWRFLSLCLAGSESESFHSFSSSVVEVQEQCGYSHWLHNNAMSLVEN